MRVTGGILGGRTVKVHKSHVRPTQDRVREALFSILGNEVINARFLDLYAGSGAVGLEGWSRGAEFVCWVELDKGVLRVLKDNVAGLCDAGTKVIGGDVVRSLKSGLNREEPFDIIFADPPYRKKVKGEDRGGQPGEVVEILSAIEAGGVIAENGLFIMEQKLRTQTGETIEGWELVKEKSYGHTHLSFFRRG